MHNFKIEFYLRLIFLISLMAIVSAYYIEYILGHQPCNLCLIERLPYASALIIIVFNLKFNPNISYTISDLHRLKIFINSKKLLG